MASAIAPTLKAATVNTQTGGTTVTLGLTSLSLAAGDRAVAIVAARAAGAITGWPAGWTQISNYPGSNTVALHAWYLDAAGGETDATLTLPSSTEAVCRVLRIDGHDAGTAPEAGTPATGSSANPNPPSVTPSWGANAMTFAIAHCSVESGGAPTAYPSGYFWQRNGINSSGGGHVGDGMAVRISQEASYDPGTFTTASNLWVAGTVCVKGAGSGASWLVDGALGNEAVATTSHDVIMPTHTEGDLLVLLADVSLVNSATVTPPTGWTSVINQSQGAGGSGNTGLLAYKVAGASESNTTFATSANEVSQNVCLAFRTHPGGVTAGAQGTGTGNNPDPPSLDAGASIDGLWLALYAADGGPTGEVPTVLPTGFMQPNGVWPTGVAQEAATFWAAEYQVAQTVNPSAFTKGSATGYVVMTAVLQAPTTGIGPLIGFVRNRLMHGGLMLR